MADPPQAAHRRPFSFADVTRARAACRAGVRRTLTALADLVFPPVCLTCGGEISSGRRHLCGDCLGRIVRIGHPLCVVCGKPFFTTVDADHLCGACANRRPPYAGSRSFGVYGGVLLDTIHLFKYHHRAYLSSVLSELVTGHDWGDFHPRQYDVMVPVPLHRRRLYERGFNQAMLLCRGIGGRWGIEIDETGLARIRETAPQIRLTPAQREKNVRGAFAAGGRGFAGKRVLLVDDVYTTGATVSECSRILMDAGAREVGILTVARVVIM